MHDDERMSTRCIIIHGSPDDEERALDPSHRSYDKHWMQWTKRALEKKGIPTIIPLMPDPWKPDYEAYKKFFDTLEVNEETILIGHSSGCAFLVRWLGDTGAKIKKLILVAPWKIAYGRGERYENRKKFYDYPINPAIRKHVSEIIIFTADDEAKDGKKSVALYHDSLGGAIRELRGHGHYTREDMGTDAFPELLAEIN